MAQRQQQSLITSGLIITIAALLLTLRFTSDLYSPVLFITKVFFLHLSFTFLITALAVSIWFRSKLIWCSLSISLLILMPFITPKWQSKTLEHTQESISIATFSTLTRTENYQDVTRFVEQRNPDILCLQEVSKPHLAKLKNELNNHYPFSISNNSNLTVFSRFEIETSHDQGAFLSTTIDIPTIGRTIIINAHMARQYRQKNIEKGWQLLLEVLQLTKSEQGILCGDLNLTPYNTMYDIITQQHGFKDSLNNGYGFTFPNAQRRIALLGPWIKIDYLLANNLISYNTKTVSASSLSDHRAVITRYKKE